MRPPTNGSSAPWSSSTTRRSSTAIPASSSNEQDSFGRLRGATSEFHQDLMIGLSVSESHIPRSLLVHSVVVSVMMDRTSLNDMSRGNRTSDLHYLHHLFGQKMSSFATARHFAAKDDHQRRRTGDENDVLAMPLTAEETSLVETFALRKQLLEHLRAQQDKASEKAMTKRRAGNIDHCGPESQPGR